MRIAIGTAFATALMISGVYAQAPAKTEISGSSAFCVVDAGKANCSYADAQSCEKELKAKGASGTRQAECVARGSVK